MDYVWGKKQKTFSNRLQMLPEIYRTYNVRLRMKGSQRPTFLESVQNGKQFPTYVVPWKRSFQFPAINYYRLSQRV